MSTTIVVLYHSSHGAVAAMAHEIAESIECQGATAFLHFEQRAPHDIVISKEDLIQCDGLAFGTPNSVWHDGRTSESILGNHQRYLVKRAINR